MSTDDDILATQLDAAWNPISARFEWEQVSAANLEIPADSKIVVIAHGNGAEIGNRVPGTVDVNATTFLALVQGNMAGPAPAAIYISTCAPGIAEFAAAVRIATQDNDIWAGTRIIGHYDAACGAVPPPTDEEAWIEIFHGRLRPRG